MAQPRQGRVLDEKQCRCKARSQHKHHRQRAQANDPRTFGGHLCAIGMGVQSRTVGCDRNNCLTGTSQAMRAGDRF